MSEAIKIATIKDYNSKIEDKFKLIRNNISKFDSADSSERRNLTDRVKSDFKLVNMHFEAMKDEVDTIKDENTYKLYKDQITLIKSDIKKLEEEFTNKQNKAYQASNLLLDEVNIEMKQKGPMTIQQAFDRGDKAVDGADKMINNIEKKVKDANDIANEIQIEQAKQIEKLTGTKKDLKEINASLKRSDANLKTMFKMYATDKLIMFMIIVIVLMIITIIIIGAVGGDKEGKFNVPHDIFVSNKGTTPTTTTTTRMLRQYW